MPRPALKLQLGLENAMHLGVKNGSKTTDETFEFTVLNDVDILIEKICHAKGRGRGLIHRHLREHFQLQPPREFKRPELPMALGGEAIINAMAIW